jgi:hypothetical protein
LPEIEKIVFPSTLTGISADTFKDVGNDGGGITLVFTGPVPVIENGAFGGSTSTNIEKVIVPQGSELAYASILASATGISNIYEFISSVGSINVTPRTLPSGGGAVGVTITGSNLDNTLRIAVDGTTQTNNIPVLSGGNWVVSGVSILGNTTNQPVTRKITAVLDGVTFPDVSADVTVAAAGSQPPRPSVPRSADIKSVDINTTSRTVTVLYPNGDTVTYAADEYDFTYPERRFTLERQSQSSGAAVVLCTADALLIPGGVSLDVKFAPVSGRGASPFETETKTQVGSDNKTYFEIPVGDLTTGRYNVTYESTDSIVTFKGTLDSDFYYNTSSSYISMFAQQIPGKMGIWATAELVPPPGVAGTRVIFTVSRSQYLPIEVPAPTDANGLTGTVTLVPDGLPDGNYTVTATAIGYEGDSVPVRIGGGGSSDTDSGGCSALASPFLLIAGAAVRAWTSQRR